MVFDHLGVSLCVLMPEELLFPKVFLCDGKYVLFDNIIFTSFSHHLHSSGKSHKLYLSRGANRHITMGSTTITSIIRHIC